MPWQQHLCRVVEWNQILRHAVDMSGHGGMVFSTVVMDDFWSIFERPWKSSERRRHTVDILSFFGTSKDSMQNMCT